jgi:hypothetical protein
MLIVHWPVQGTSLFPVLMWLKQDCVSSSQTLALIGQSAKTPWSDLYTLSL